MDSETLCKRQNNYKLFIIFSGEIFFDDHDRRGGGFILGKDVGESIRDVFEVLDIFLIEADFLGGKIRAGLTFSRDAVGECDAGVAFIDAAVLVGDAVFEADIEADVRAALVGIAANGVAQERAADGADSVFCFRVIASVDFGEERVDFIHEDDAGDHLIFNIETDIDGSGEAVTIGRCKFNTLFEEILGCFNEGLDIDIAKSKRAS